MRDAQCDCSKSAVHDIVVVEHDPAGHHNGADDCHDHALDDDAVDDYELAPYYDLVDDVEYPSRDDVHYPARDDDDHTLSGCGRPRHMEPATPGRADHCRPRR